jgi:hypothetical protein
MEFTSPIVILIADYSMPVADDVRVAWFDDERQTEDIINAIFDGIYKANTSYKFQLIKYNTANN